MYVKKLMLAAACAATLMTAALVASAPASASGPVGGPVGGPAGVHAPQGVRPQPGFMHRKPVRRCWTEHRRDRRGHVHVRRVCR